VAWQLGHDAYCSRKSWIAKITKPYVMVRMPNLSSAFGWALLSPLLRWLLPSIGTSSLRRRLSPCRRLGIQLSAIVLTHPPSTYSVPVMIAVVAMVRVDGATD
jgi:hypothetical protein